MREYIRNITKTNDLILNGTLGNDEINRFSKADYRWADNKRKSFQTRKIKKGKKDKQMIQVGLPQETSSESRSPKIFAG